MKKTLLSLFVVSTIKGRAARYNELKRIIQQEPSHYNHLAAGGTSKMVGLYPFTENYKERNDEYTYTW